MLNDPKVPLLSIFQILKQNKVIYVFQAQSSIYWPRLRWKQELQML